MRLNDEEIENLKRTMASRETESVNKTSQQRKAQDQMDTLVNTTEYLKNCINSPHRFPKK